jgi:hypothetical protein
MSDAAATIRSRLAAPSVRAGASHTHDRTGTHT